VALHYSFLLGLCRHAGATPIFDRMLDRVARPGQVLPGRGSRMGRERPAASPGITKGNKRDPYKIALSA